MNEVLCAPVLILCYGAAKLQTVAAFTHTHTHTHTHTDIYVCILYIYIYIYILLVRLHGVIILYCTVERLRKKRGERGKERLIERVIER